MNKALTIELLNGMKSVSQEESSSNFTDTVLQAFDWGTITADDLKTSLEWLGQDALIQGRTELLTRMEGLGVLARALCTAGAVVDASVRRQGRDRRALAAAPPD